MDAQDFRSLQEAYMEVVENQQLDEASPIYSRGGEQRRTQTPRQIGVKGAPHNIPRGGTTISDRDPQGKRLFTGDQDRGKGNKAARRADALKPKQKYFPNRLRRADGQGIRDSYEYGFSEGKVAWDDPKNPLQSGYTPKEKSEAKRKQLGVDNPETKSFEKGGPGEKEYARHSNLSAAQKKMEKRGQQPKGKPHQFKKDPFWKKTQGQVKRTMFGTNVPKDKKSSYPASVATTNEEVDIYDIILSHLLDEGYAETPEAAEVIMVNMSEEWRNSIIG